MRPHCDKHVPCADCEMRVRADERHKVTADLDNIWRKYRAKSWELDGFHDSDDAVLEKFMQALREQIDYFQR